MKDCFKNGLRKAVTFSYDDGVKQDFKLVEIFNKYGVKCTFNLNYGLLNEKIYWKANNEVVVKRIKSSQVSDLYKGHEIACHGLNHFDIPSQTYAEKKSNYY